MKKIFKKQKMLIKIKKNTKIKTNNFKISLKYTNIKIFIKIKMKTYQIHKNQ